MPQTRYARSAGGGLDRWGKDLVRRCGGPKGCLAALRTLLLALCLLGRCRCCGRRTGDELQVAMAHNELADSLARDARLTEAAHHYELAMRASENVEARADLGLVEVILEAKWSDRYGEAREVLLKSDASRDPFPATRFRWNLAAARLASRRGEETDARELARIALRCLDETESPFPRHRKLGLASADRKTLRELRRMARG